ncbi:MAG: histidine kinase [Proteobacteria bacterium]|nr:histidine kinase [Pseudomonadota bacterium]
MKNISPMTLAESLRGILGWTECYAAWGALFLAQVFSLRIIERERQLSELREQAYGAQMRALRYQINPHFLFNTLNALATLIEEGEAKNAERMVLSLSAFLRSTLALDPMQDITLAEELDIQARYLEVERERYSDRLTVSFDVPEQLKRARVPSFILQPLVENAVKHGVGALDQAVRILICADADRNVLSIHVENDAPEPGRPSTGTGTGLKNVAQRLATRFGDQASLNSERTADGVFRATVAMPLRYSAA